MKYKKHITTGVLALSLLLGGSSAYAASTQEIGVNYNSYKVGHKITVKGNQLVGTITAIGANSFTLEKKEKKNLKNITPLDVQTSSTTVFTKDGASASFTDLSLGEKIIVAGSVDVNTKIVNATKVKMVTNVPSIKALKVNKTNKTSKKN